MITKAKIVSILVPILVLAAGLTALATVPAGSGEVPVTESPPLDPPKGTKHVRVASAESVSLAEDVRFSGVTRGAKSALASFTVGGRLLTRPVEIGDPVRRGQAVATLDGREYANGLASTRAALAETATRLAQAERDVRRSRTLFDKGAATREELEKVDSGADSLRAQHDSIKARVGELERLVEESTLTAPISGTVSEVFLEPGEYAAPGRPVIAISGRDGVEVEIELPETMILDVGVGTEVKVEFPLLGRDPAPGRVTSIATSSLGPGRLFPVIVTFEDPSLIPGLTAEVVLERRLDRGWAVPVEAVMNPGGRNAYVFVVRDSIARRENAEVRRLLGEKALIEGVIADGDPIVVEGQFSLLDGDPVVIQKDPTRLAHHRGTEAIEGGGAR